jgi:phospholipase/lecithinase/hemolysin
MHPRNTPTVDRFVILGNSTTDRGTFMKRKLFGFVPMRWIASIFKKTHDDRFTNGHTWADDFSAMIASRFLADHFLNEHKQITRDTDIADAVITRDHKIVDEISSAYNLKNDKIVSYKNSAFCRMYAEGGLTAADYRCKFTINPLNEIPRLIVSSLARQRQKLIADNDKNQVSDTAKAKTLVIEWTGGNDLITVNSKPDQQAAAAAIEARIENLKALIEHGYRHFVLFTMPDLSVTPRFRNSSTKDKINAAVISLEFNEELKRRCEELKYTMPDRSIDVFDINPTLEKVLASPELYGFDRDKTTVEFIKSDEYKKNKNNEVLPASRYLFWDDVHPSAHVHALLAAEFYDEFSKLYHLRLASEPPVASTSSVCY